jgi:hypothetical protein
MELATALRVAPFMPGGNLLPRKSDAISKPWEERHMMMQLMLMQMIEISIFPIFY